MALYPAPADRGSPLGWPPHSPPTGVGTASFSAVRLSATFPGEASTPLPFNFLFWPQAGSLLLTSGGRF